MNAADFLYVGEPPNALPYYVAIGRLCVTWGPVESAVSVLAVQAYNNFPEFRPQKKGNKGDAPPSDSFSNKLDLVSKALRSRLPEPDYSTSVAPLIDDLRTANGDRNILFHTNWSEIWGSLEGSPATGHRIKSAGGMYQSITGMASLNDLYTLTEHLTDLSTRLVPLVASGILNPKPEMLG